jgi:hypothetical protein
MGGEFSGYIIFTEASITPNFKDEYMCHSLLTEPTTKQSNANN